MLRRLGAGPGLQLLSPLAEYGPGDTCSAVVGPKSLYPTGFRVPGNETIQSLLNVSIDRQCVLCYYLCCSVDYTILSIFTIISNGSISIYIIVEVNVVFVLIFTFSIKM